MWYLGAYAEIAMEFSPIWAAKLKKRGCIKRIKKVFSQRRQENAKIVISCSLVCYIFLLCGHFAASCEKFTFETAPFKSMF